MVGPGALRRYKERGEPVVVWQDGKIVWLQPEEIPVSDGEESSKNDANTIRKEVVTVEDDA
ncbi:MAG: hypothetical protein OHK0029_26440 [Armatimonadaceae bacterium]